jgi:serine protease Do
LNVPVDQTAVPRDGLPRGSYAPIVDKVAPAVVKIEITATRQNAAMEGLPDSLRQFFGNQFGGMLPPQSMGPRVEHGLGSGVVITKDGYILTNNHVVDGAKEVKVTLTDGREFTAKVIGRDPKTDIAVVKIDADSLPVVPLADSSNVKVGDVVLAVGNPFGVGQTVTEGIVSAKNRGNMGIEDYEDFIQTDAAINPGNSGGALVDIDGRLIGINTAILSDSGGSQGVGFAVPSDLARTVMESLVKNGHVTRGYLGVMIQNVTPALAQEFNLKAPTGALIGDVVANGPADQAGFKDGDVVTEFNGQKITDSRQLQLAVAETSPGSKVTVKILRDGDSKTLEVTVKQLPGTGSVADAGSQNGNDTGTLNGIGVGDLDPQTRAQFHIPDTVHGAVVTQVEPGSAAAEAGLKTGDVIESINRQPVKNADDAVQLTTNTASKQTLVRVWDNGGSRYIVVDESHSEG